jgi:hypothetical protein
MTNPQMFSVERAGAYGLRKSIPVIMREKICNPDPDMYIIIAFMGILKWGVS